MTTLIGRTVCRAQENGNNGGGEEKQKGREQQDNMTAYSSLHCCRAAREPRKGVCQMPGDQGQATPQENMTAVSAD